MLQNIPINESSNNCKFFPGGCSPWDINGNRMTRYDLISVEKYLKDCILIIGGNYDIDVEVVEYLKENDFEYLIKNRNESIEWYNKLVGQGRNVVILLHE